MAHPVFISTSSAPRRSGHSLAIHTLRTFLIAFMAIALSGCAPAPNKAEQDFLRMWSAHTNSVQELAEAVNRRFTNGTPISYIVSILGKNDSTLRPFSAIDPATGRTPVGATCSLMYSFGEDTVYIRTTAPLDADPLPAKFTGAGFTMHVKGTQTIVYGGGQPTGAAKGSQPIRSETNGTSGAAGSRR
jgi:hypothetical protein